MLLHGNIRGKGYADISEKYGKRDTNSPSGISHGGPAHHLVREERGRVCKRLLCRGVAPKRGDLIR